MNDARQGGSLYIYRIAHFARFDRQGLPFTVRQEHKLYGVAVRFGHCEDLIAAKGIAAHAHLELLHDVEYHGHTDHFRVGIPIPALPVIDMQPENAKVEVALLSYAPLNLVKFFQCILHALCPAMLHVIDCFVQSGKKNIHGIIYRLHIVLSVYRLCSLHCFHNPHPFKMIFVKTVQHCVTQLVSEIS